MGRASTEIMEGSEGALTVVNSRLPHSTSARCLMNDTFSAKKISHEKFQTIVTSDRFEFNMKLGFKHIEK